MLLDLWVAEAQLLGGWLYLEAFRAFRAGAGWQALAPFGALTVVGYAGLFIPVLFAGAPWMFRIQRSST
jgi:hypothetical protein